MNQGKRDWTQGGSRVDIGSGDVNDMVNPCKCGRDDCATCEEWAEFEWLKMHGTTPKVTR